MAVMDALKEVYTMNDVGIVEYYLGGDVEQLDKHWSAEQINLRFSGQTYIKNAIFIIGGPEFGHELEGRILIVVKALYRLHSSAARFHEHLADTLCNLGFWQSCADHTSGSEIPGNNMNSWRHL